MQITLSKLFRQFRRDETGSSSVEFVIWMPLLLAALLAVLEFSHAMVVNAGMWHSARDTARAVAMHRMTEDEAEAHFRDTVYPPNSGYRVEIRTDADSVTVSAALAGEDLPLAQLLSGVFRSTLAAEVSMLREPI